mmetsp:Transcript_12250/g.17584  ORF Transcript_12250/g.17584 Transcript_12250/m.17584 type:complete len:81 (+) Transcript_12250:52-294(+)
MMSYGENVMERNCQDKLLGGYVEIELSNHRGVTQDEIIFLSKWEKYQSVGMCCSSSSPSPSPSPSREGGGVPLCQLRLPL